MTALRRSPDEVSGVGRPADTRQFLAAIIVRGTTTRNTTWIPPVQEAAAVGVPAADGPQALEERVVGRLWARGLRKQSRAADQCDNQCPDPHLVSHESFLR